MRGRKTFGSLLFCDCCDHLLSLSRKKLKDREVDIYLCIHNNHRPDECSIITTLCFNYGLSEKIKINLTIVFLNKAQTFIQIFLVIKAYHDLFAKPPIPPKAFGVSVAIFGRAINLFAADIHHQHPGLSSLSCRLEDAHDILDLCPCRFAITYSQQSVFDPGFRQMIIFTIGPCEPECHQAAAGHKNPRHPFCVGGNAIPNGLLR